MKLLKKYWGWGVAAIASVFALLLRFRKREPSVTPTLPTRAEVEKGHAEIEKKKREKIQRFEDDIDEELKNALEKFGG